MKKPDLEYIDECAFRAMESMLKGIYSDPAMMAAIAEDANANENNPVEEIAYRAYLMAKTMQEQKQKMFKETK